jgi:hypothetical protein
MRARVFRAFLLHRGLHGLEQIRGRHRGIVLRGEDVIGLLEIFRRGGETQIAHCDLQLVERRSRRNRMGLVDVVAQDVADH